MGYSHNDSVFQSSLLGDAILVTAGWLSKTQRPKNDKTQSLGHAWRRSQKNNKSWILSSKEPQHKETKRSELLTSVQSGSAEWPGWGWRNVGCAHSPRPRCSCLLPQTGWAGRSSAADCVWRCRCPAHACCSGSSGSAAETDRTPVRQLIKRQIDNHKNRFLCRLLSLSTNMNQLELCSPLLTWFNIQQVANTLGTGG